MKPRFACILLCVAAIIAVIPANADRVWLYAPQKGTFGTDIAGPLSGASESKWLAQPFHVPYDAFMDYLGAGVGKASDPNNVGIYLRLVEDNITWGWPGATIGEWNIKPATADAKWTDLTIQPILLHADRRYWIMIRYGDPYFWGQIALATGEGWALRSFDQGATWQDWGFRAAVRVAGYPVPEPGSAAGLTLLAIAGGLRTIGARRRST